MTTTESAEASGALIRLLQRAHAGEGGAEKAYTGHAASVRDPKEKQDILEIRQQELDHRACVLSLLDDLGAGPDPRLEKRVARVGRTLGFVCRVSGWFFPMYGAAWLEARNVEEYVQAARLARSAGREDMVPPLLDMARVEWDHELYFREKAQSHWMWKLLPHWAPLPPREGLEL